MKWQVGIKRIFRDSYSVAAAGDRGCGGGRTGGPRYGRDVEGLFPSSASILSKSTFFDCSTVFLNLSRSTTMES